MLMVLTSPDAVLKKGLPDPQVAKVLADVAAVPSPVALISNHGKPSWFDQTFGGTKVQFVQSAGRQSGEVISINAKQFNLQPHDCIVLASKAEDMQMGKNGGAVLCAAGWSGDARIKDLGIRVDDANQFREVISLTQGWQGQWWFSGDGKRYAVRALCDLSQINKGITQQVFAEKITSTVKNGGARLNALLAVTARSLLMEGAAALKDTLWGVYPSSHSANNDTEILSDFSHRLRTTVSRVRMCEKGQPLFMRHIPSVKRSAGGGGDRTDPTGQLVSLHLNPHYKRRLSGRRVFILDDCTTYGVSFGVAAALLRKVGAASVTGVALGKFGNRLSHYDIEIGGDPFKPLSAKDFEVKNVAAFAGANNNTSQNALQALIP